MRTSGLADELKVSVRVNSSEVVKYLNGCCPALGLCKTNGMRSCLWAPLLWVVTWKGQAAAVHVLNSLGARNLSESFLRGKTGEKSIARVISLTWRYFLCS